MSLFTDVEPDYPPRRRGGGWFGWSLLGFAITAIVVVALLPSPYVIEKPGPVFDTLGTVAIEGEDVPLIDIPMEETFPTTGSLNLLTVSIVGNRDNPLRWFETATAWLDPSKAVVPIDQVYPQGVTVEQSSEASRIQMEVSQQESIAAALDRLGYDFTSTLTIAGLTEGSASDGIVEEGDVIQSLNGESYLYVSQMREAIAANGVDKPMTLVVDRDGVEQTLEVTPTLSPENGTAERQPVLGVLISNAYDFPFDVTIQLENVGGPSAGQMFALGIIDKLTEGDLNGGEDVAGTGTITGEGDIGPIGGIRQKMYGALDAGATYFLAPEANCDEVTGHIPDGLTVFAVEDLDDSMTALAGIASGEIDDIATCPAG
ncbi:ATP-dependent serine peptidase containing a PDZ domain protein [Glaciihabitans arcticus]|uniref:endopeptidase La n=1 Tax=Glaciihabitans arcticus TaxID=2668039 RepID=A0A4Q9GYD5_9MICO|nr:S16 family serine protease [Glaciihabitans arcticus]TBN57310.1 ATP-dependent serine peptidase containing a PDZ domain protein [Glaciihabitans arcticus]